MPTTLNRTRYAKLLAQAMPRVIRNDKELEQFTQTLLALDERPRPRAKNANWLNFSPLSSWNTNRSITRFPQLHRAKSWSFCFPNADSPQKIFGRWWGPRA